jgi:hypothetical protein
MKLLSSLLPKPMQLPFYALAAASSAAGLGLIRALPPATPPVQKPLLQKIGTASSLLVSYRPIQLLAPTEMVFGFSAAMMNAWVNGAGRTPSVFVTENDRSFYQDRLGTHGRAS